MQLRGRCVKLHLFFSWARTRCLSTLPLPGVATMSTACSAPRQIYIDAGVNWCNTLELYRRIPEAKAFLEKPWLVFGFEASPRIAPFADRCAQTLSAGLPLPPPPIPPAGSSRELAKYAPLHNCSMEQLGLRPRSEHDRKVYRRQKLVPCMLKALEKPLASLTPDPQLTGNQTLLQQRLAPGGACATKTHYALLSAAVGRRDGFLSMNDGPEMMITGGATHQATFKSRIEKYRVPQVDLSSWLRKSFSRDDFVVLKLDVEGVEHRIVPKMVEDGTLELVDVLLWECHHMPRSWHSPCHKLLKSVRDHGVKVVYEDPYPF